MMVTIVCINLSNVTKPLKFINKHKKMLLGVATGLTVVLGHSIPALACGTMLTSKITAYVLGTHIIITETVNGVIVGRFSMLTSDFLSKSSYSKNVCDIVSGLFTNNNSLKVLDYITKDGTLYETIFNIVKHI